jgi:hypothetical protein
VSSNLLFLDIYVLVSFFGAGNLCLPDTMPSTEFSKKESKFAERWASYSVCKQKYDVIQGAG